VIKFISDLRQVGGFRPGTPVSSTNKTDRHDITEILLKVALNTIILTLHRNSTLEKPLILELILYIWFKFFTAFNIGLECNDVPTRL
jgi:hypothetical protein